MDQKIAVLSEVKSWFYPLDWDSTRLLCELLVQFCVCILLHLQSTETDNKQCRKRKESVGKIMGQQRIASLQVAIGAGKGGVGKSMLTAQIAGYLAAKGYKVGVLDADLYGPSQPTMLKVDRPASAQTKEGVEEITPARSQGISYVSLGLFRPSGSAVAARAPIVTGMISRFLKHVHWGKLDFLLIDLPPGTGDIQLSLAQQISCDAACLVSTPGKVCLEDVRRSSSLFTQMQIPILGYILNMAFMDLPGSSEEKVYPFGRPDEKTWDNMLQASCLAQLPLDPSLNALANEGVTLASQDSKGQKSKIASQLHELSTLLESFLKRREGSQESFFRLLPSEKSADQVTLLGHPLLKAVQLIDAKVLLLENLEGQLIQLDLMKLVELCPCAGCCNTEDKNHKSEGEWKLLHVESVGNYGLKVLTQAGCPLGIFPVDELFHDARYVPAHTALADCIDQDKSY